MLKNLLQIQLKLLPKGSFFQKGFGLKTGTFPRLLVVALSHLLWPSGWHVTFEAQINHFKS